LILTRYLNLAASVILFRETLTRLIFLINLKLPLISYLWKKKILLFIESWLSRLPKEILNMHKKIIFHPSRRILKRGYFVSVKLLTNVFRLFKTANQLNHQDLNKRSKLQLRWLKKWFIFPKELIQKLLYI
jgi:hypothetical protein